MNNEKMVTNKVEAEYLEIANKNAWPFVYQKIGRECQSYPYTCLEAKKPQNKPLNRYRDVNPYDHSRIILTKSDKDYINANLVKMERANRKYILTQGPLAFTVSHFWLMVWEQNSRAILMLNKVIEKNEIKCHWYWPHDKGPAHKMVMSEVGLAVEEVSEEDHGYYTTRLFKIMDLETQESREVIQFHYTTWPDFGVPSSPVAFLDFLKRVRDAGVLSPDVGPPVVHCSAGIGRSGTFCLVDSCLVIIENEGVNSVNVQDVLLEMRRDRMGLIQTPDQLRFSYQAIIEGAKRLDPNYNAAAAAEASTSQANSENIYETVAESEASEEAPPPPPPRGESLGRPPARPLPAIPASTSLGDMKYSQGDESESSDSAPPTPPPRAGPAPAPAPASASATPASSPASSADDEDDEPPALANDSGSGGGSGESPELRRRRKHQQELSDRVAAMKRKARDAERWHKLKRSLYKPLTITLGFFLASILIYSYVRH